MQTVPENLQARLRAVSARIAGAARAAGRDPSGVRLVAVSKTFSAAAVEGALAAGQRSFGENYVQEGVGKIESLRALRSGLEWHFIGPIQSNKTRSIAEQFDWVQSVDRLKVAQRLAEQRPDGLPALNVLLQVNVSGEATKSGVAPAEVDALAREIAILPRLKLRGLMAIPEPGPDAARQREPLAAMRSLFAQMRGNGFDFDTLSMGMSDDLESAVLEGSTMVRVGTAIFGERERRHP